MKRFFFIAATTIMGTFLGYGIALGIWEMANPATRRRTLAGRWLASCSACLSAWS